MIFVSSVTGLEFRTWMIFDKRARLSFCVSLWPAGVRLPRCQRQTVSAVLSQGGEKDTLRYWKVQQAEGRHCRGTVARWEFLGCKMSAVHTQSIYIFCTLVLRFATAVSRPACVPFFSSYFSLCLLILCLQVELDLKRLRDPLQLQLPVQQLTASKNWWEEWLPLLLSQLQQPFSAPTTSLPSCCPHFFAFYL